jgi:hypothetical protein
MSVLCHPLILVPSLITNYIMYNKYRMLFQGDRARVMNMFLKPSGKEVIIETQDGNSKVVDTLSIFGAKHIKARYEDRLEFSHGANVYCYLTGKYIILDKWVLDKVLACAFIDCKNQTYDFDITKEFTWDFRELVEIKKRKRFVTKIYRPTLQNLLRKQSADNFDRARKKGTVVSNVKPYPRFELYRYYPDKYSEDKADEQRKQE